MMEITTNSSTNVKPQRAFIFASPGQECDKVIQRQDNVTLVNQPSPDERFSTSSDGRRRTWLGGREVRHANYRLRRGGRNKFAHGQHDFHGRRSDENLSQRMMLAMRVMIAIVLTAVWMVGRNLRHRRWANGGSNSNRLLIAVVFNPFVQPLPEQRNYAVAKEHSSGRETVNHGSAIAGDSSERERTIAHANTPAIALQ